MGKKNLVFLELGFAIMDLISSGKVSLIPDKPVLTETGDDESEFADHGHVKPLKNCI